MYMFTYIYIHIYIHTQTYVLNLWVTNPSCTSHLRAGATAHVRMYRPLAVRARWGRHSSTGPAQARSRHGKYGCNTEETGRDQQKIDIDQTWCTMGMISFGMETSCLSAQKVQLNGRNNHEALDHTGSYWISPHPNIGSFSSKEIRWIQLTDPHISKHTELCQFDVRKSVSSMAGHSEGTVPVSFVTTSGYFSPQYTTVI